MAKVKRCAGVAIAVAALSLLSLAPGARAEPAGGVLLVGDSLEELTYPHLAKFLPGVPLTVNAVGGYNSFQVYDLFEESYDPSQRVIVFDAGTNDNPSYPQILAGNLAKVAATVGDRCMVVPTIHGMHPGGVDDSGKNRVVAEFAASRPGTQTPDWQSAVFSHPELMQADNLHPIEAGAELRARLIAQGVMACLTGAAGASASSAPPRPVLARAPQHLPRVDAMAERRDELLAAVANTLVFATIRRMSSRAPLLAPAALAWMEAASD